MAELRYYRLKGKAKIEEEEGLLKITLLNENGTPAQPPLHFDSPLASNTSISIANLPDEAINIDLLAAFDEVWFNFQVGARFPFKKEDGSSIGNFIDLAPPAPMGVVKPTIAERNLLKEILQAPR